MRQCFESCLLVIKDVDFDRNPSRAPQILKNSIEDREKSVFFHFTSSQIPKHQQQLTLQLYRKSVTQYDATPVRFRT